VGERVTVGDLQAMKPAGRKIVGVVAWDFQVARIADRAGVDVVSVGDSVGMNLWGRTDPQDVTLDEMILICRAVRRGVTRALVSCDFPYGPLQQGTQSALAAARRVVEEGGADIVKLDGAAEFPAAVTAIARAGTPVFAQMGITQGNAQRYGIAHAKLLGGAVQVPEEMAGRLVDEARLLESAGAALIDFTSSGPIAGPQVTRAVSIPVLGGLGGGPWLDGRMRMAHAAIGYAASNLESKTETYANVARVALDALTAYAEDVRAARQIKGGIPLRPAS
jgi:3-methyl-2-oxobutanoate hydroxymethyltransferase